jgi:hypothetical protein
MDDRADPPAHASIQSQSPTMQRVPSILNNDRLRSVCGMLFDYARR